MGSLIGRVERIERNKVFMKDAGVLNNGDGICFFDGSGVLSGIRVNSAASDYFTVTALNGLAEGMELHRNLDKEFVAAWMRQPAQRRLGITFMLTQDSGFLKLKGVDETGVEVEKVMEKPDEVARDMDRLHTMVRKQLGKTGGTPFYVQEIFIAAEVDALISASVMNAMRRDVLELLIQQRLQEYVRDEVRIKPGDTPWPEQEVLFNGNVANGLARKFYIRHGARVRGMAPEVSGTVLPGQVVMTTRHCVRYDMGWCKKYRAPGCVDAQQHAIKEPLMIRNDQGRVFELRFDCKNCVMEVLTR
jgi:putative protease